MAGQSSDSAAAQQELLRRLEAILPNEPAVATAEAVVLMEAVGETKRLDAALLLIRALAFNVSPAGSNESRSLVEMIPAAVILKRHFGPAALPLLMFAGAGSEQEWLQRRIALVVREIGTETEVGGLRSVFSISSAAGPAARRFAELLDADDLRIELADPGRELLRHLKKDGER